jgi:hypothetical protein
MIPTQTIAGERAVKLRPLRAAAVFVVGALLALLVSSTSDFYVHALVSLMLFSVVVPAWYHWQRARLDIFETIHVIGFLYFIFFGVGAIWLLQDPVAVAYDIYIVPYVPKAVLYCLLGYLALLCGYLGPWFRGTVRARWEEIPKGVLFILIPGFLGFLGSIAEAIWSRSRWLGVSSPAIFSSLAQLAPLFMFAWALSWLLIFSGRATRGQTYLTLGIFVPATLTVGLASLSDKSLAMTLMGVPVIALWYARRKIPWKTLLLMFMVLVFIVFPFYNTFRALDPRIAGGARVALTYEIASAWDYDEYLEQSVGTAKRRMAMINSVAVVLRDVGRWVPYAYGETLFTPALTFFIPRILWPDKPYFTMGREFAETFRVVAILDRDTRVAVTVPGELYWNFDLPGILLGMALWGAVLRFLYRRYGEAVTLDPVRRAIHIVLLIQFVHFGGGLAAQAVSVLRILLVLEAYRWISRQAGLIEVKPIQTARQAVGQAFSFLSIGGKGRGS